MRKFIHSSFELDLSPYKITDTSENPWFTGNYFAKYSYPFEIVPDDALEQALGFVSHHNAVANTMFEGTYVHGDVMEKAVLEIEEIEKGLSVTLRYGFEDFPNFSKKLSELPLLRQAVDNIYTHAAGVITQTWPDVNYNFPQIHTDKINPEDDDVWFAFEKIINNYKDGAFLVNDVDLEEEITYNRNIMQPLPYVLYVVKAGIEAAGYTLHGDILEDTDLQKLLMYIDTDYFTLVNQESIPILVPATEYESMTGPRIVIHKQYDIPQPGKYRITGKVNIRAYAAGELIQGTVQIWYRDQLLLSTNAINIFNPVKVVNVDIIFETLSDLETDEITIRSLSMYDETDIVWDLYINPIRLHDESGAAIPGIINLNEVDLTRAVPDMTFGDLVKLVLALKNMDMTARGTELWINKVAREIEQRPAIDLSMYEVKYPNRKFSKGNSFLFRYQEIDSKDYTYAAVFQSKDGTVNADYVTDEKTTEININALPLPLLMRNGVQTAYGFIQDNTKPFFVIYNGLTGGKNLSKDPAALLIPYLHEQNYKDWFSARIDSIVYKWSFTAWYEELITLNAKSSVHAFGNNHLVQSLQKTEVRPDLFEVEIETVSFK